MMKRLIILMYLFSLTMTVQAEWISVTGTSKVVNGNHEKARERARNDAFQQAVEHFGARIHSRQEIEHGHLKNDYLSVSSDARIRSSRVDDQYVKAGVLHLVMSVDVEDIPACPDSRASQYKKKVAIMGFSVQHPAQQRLGGLKDTERGISSALNQALLKQDQLLVYESSDASFYQELTNAPTRFTEQNTLTKAAVVAKELGVQFVISGVVRDLSLEDPDAFSTSFISGLFRRAGAKNINRRFALELFVHDGFSGAVIWQRLFTVSAPWEADIDKQIGFNSAQFWSMTYGKAVDHLLQDIAYLVGEQLSCQPFMTRIARIDGKVLHFSSGASSGLRPGDKLSLYRTFNAFDSDMLKSTELTNVKTVLTVSQVHPNFASGKISVDPGRINIQEDDLLVIW